MSGSPALAFQVIGYGSVAAEGFKDLVGAARKAMLDTGLTDVRTDLNGRFAEGRTPNSHDVIAFVGGTSSNTNAVIMSAGDDAFPQVAKLASALQKVNFL